MLHDGRSEKNEQQQTSPNLVAAQQKRQQVYVVYSFLSRFCVMCRCLPCSPGPAIKGFELICTQTHMVWNISSHSIFSNMLLALHALAQKQRSSFWACSRIWEMVCAYTPDRCQSLCSEYVHMFVQNMVLIAIRSRINQFIMKLDSRADVNGRPTEYRNNQVAIYCIVRGAKMTFTCICESVLLVREFLRIE